MRRIGGRIAALIGIFILSVIVFSLLAGTEGTVNETQEMSEATFPVLFFTCGGEEVNETFGYAQQMDGSSIRDTITPVADDLTIPITIDAYENEIVSVSYNVYSSDGQELLEEHSAVSVEVSDGEAQSSVVLYDEIDADTEAVLEVILTVNEGELLYYYTRVTMQNDVPLTLAMSFAKTFHEETLSGSDGSSLSAYLETDSGTEYTSLSHVTIESTLSLVMWGSLSPVLASGISIDIAEVNESYQAFTMTYLVSSALTGATYYVEEYFRIRIVSSQPYLLDYDRTAEQLFAAVDDAVSEEVLELGIRDADVEYLSSDDGSIAAFVQAGELWEYDANSGKLSRVYGFLDTDANGSADSDLRHLNMDHEIRICSMDESGNLYFLLCGYRNRGEHEGENGISLFYYDAINRTVEEKVFLTSTSSYQVLKEEIGDLSYVNSAGNFCLIYGNTLYEVNLDTIEAVELDSDIDAEYSVISESGRYAAWLYGADDGLSQTLSIVDLKTGAVTEISGDGGYVRPIGFLGENLVYGIAQADDLVQDAAGNITFAMNTLVILDTDFSVKKQYDEGNYYVTEAVIEDGSVRLERVTKTSDGYEEAAEDTIIDYDSLDDSSVSVSTAEEDSTQEEQVVLCFSVSAADEIAFSVPEVTVTDGREETSLLQGFSDSPKWRVYRKQDLVYAGDSLCKAISLADEDAGVVMSADGILIWRRNNTSSASVSDLSAQTDAADSLTASLISALEADGVSDETAETAAESAETAEDAVNQALSAALYLDLSGCTLEEVLWFTAQGRPVLAVLDGTTMIIESYTSSSVTFYNPRTGGSSYYGMSAAESLFEEAGNLFFTWIL